MGPTKKEARKIAARVALKSILPVLYEEWKGRAPLEDGDDEEEEGMIEDNREIVIENYAEDMQVEILAMRDATLCQESIDKMMDYLH